MSQLRILGPSGDKTVAWEPADAETTANARAQFNDLLDHSYALYLMPADKGAGQGERVTRFDPHAVRIIAVPPMVGG